MQTQQKGTHDPGRVSSDVNYIPGNKGRPTLVLSGNTGHTLWLASDVSAFPSIPSSGAPSPSLNLGVGVRWKGNLQSLQRSCSPGAENRDLRTAPHQSEEAQPPPIRGSPDSHSSGSQSHFLWVAQEEEPSCEACRRRSRNLLCLEPHCPEL